MPIFSATSGQFGFGFTFQTASFTPAALPSYYTSSSDYALTTSINGTGTGPTLFYNALNPNTSIIRTYAGIALMSNYIIHDKDLDSNIYYGLTPRFGTATTRTLYKYTLQKNSTTISQTLITTFTNITSLEANVGSPAYAPACMWDSTSYGALVFANRSGSTAPFPGNIMVIEFDASKQFSRRYYVYNTDTLDISNITSIDMIPKQASGFTNHYAVAGRTQNGTPSLIESWAVTMSLGPNGWIRNPTPTSWTNDSTGPQNLNTTLYYPIGKPAYVGDTNTSMNRIGLIDSLYNLYIWTITENNGSLVFTFGIKLSYTNIGRQFYIYPLSPNTYNSIA